jgi:hypothetical protein
LTLSLADVTSRSQLVLVCHVLPRGCVVESRLLGLMLVRVESFRYFLVDVRRSDKPGGRVGLHGLGN